MALPRIKLEVLLLQKPYFAFLLRKLSCYIAFLLIFPLLQPLIYRQHYLSIPVFAWIIQFKSIFLLSLISWLYTRSLHRKRWGLKYTCIWEGICLNVHGEKQLLPCCWHELQQSFSLLCWAWAEHKSEDRSLLTKQKDVLEQDLYCSSCWDSLCMNSLNCFGSLHNTAGDKLEVALYNIIESQYCKSMKYV